MREEYVKNDDLPRTDKKNPMTRLFQKKKKDHRKYIGDDRWCINNGGKNSSYWAES